jgi:hypothetical protein
MTPTRLAALHKAIARAHEALAEELEREAGASAEDEDAPAAEAAPPPRHKAPRSRRIPLVKPTGRVKPTAVDQKRADALVRRHYGGST